MTAHDIVLCGAPRVHRAARRGVPHSAFGGRRVHAVCGARRDVELARVGGVAIAAARATRACRVHGLRPADVFSVANLEDDDNHSVIDDFVNDSMRPQADDFSRLAVTAHASGTGV